MRDETDPTKAYTYVVRANTLAFKYYLSLCQSVTHEAPYVPE
jgi:hypothetical protein